MDQQETGFVYDMNLVDNRYIFARYSESKICMSMISSLPVGWTLCYPM